MQSTHPFAVYPLQVLKHLISPQASYLCPCRDHYWPASEQAGFRHGRSTIDKVTLLTQDIEESFLAKKEGWAAYDTIWHCSLTCKLLHLLPDRHMVKIIMELVTNCSFTLTTGRGTCSRLQCLKNGVPLGLVLAQLLITSTHMTCQHQSCRNMHMQTILHLCILLETGRPLKGLLTKN